MKLFTQDDCQTQLTVNAPSFVTLLAEVLTSVGWPSVELTGSVLNATNVHGKRIKVSDLNGVSALVGYHNETDTRGFPSINQMPNITAQQGVGIFRSPLNPSWKLFASDSSFFFHHSNKLSGFGYFTPLFDDDEVFFVLGAETVLNTTQTLLVTNPTLLSTVLCLEGNGIGLSLSKLAGARVFYPIDDYDFKQYATSTLVATSPIAIHHSDTKSLRGFLADVLAFSSSFTTEGEIFSMGGYTIYCIVVDNRCLGIRLDG